MSRYAAARGCWIALWLWGIASLLALAGCTSSAASLPNPFHSSARHAQVGDQVQLGSQWIATLVSVTTSASAQGQVAAGGDTFLVVTMSFKNVSSSQQTLYTAATVVLQDAAGHRYAQANLPSPPSLDGPVAAGQTNTGPLYFQVPITQHRFELAYQGLGSASGQAVWDITLPS